jgi:hypothetical protein
MVQQRVEECDFVTGRGVVERISFLSAASSIGFIIASDYFSGIGSTMLRQQYRGKFAVICVTDQASRRQARLMHLP